jgi:Zn-dependent peptidase ImmA (M78 family)/transcriptional regulator with XRE-family HTH domain
MKVGTPGFLGSRLREARESRGLTTVALADLVGVSRAAISQYELGHALPRPEVMERLVDVLRFPASFFMSRRPGPSPKFVYYRSLASASKTARARAEHRLSWVYRDIVPFLTESVRFPTVNYPSFNGPSDPAVLRDDEIERCATEARRFWGLGNGPISNVVWLLENNGTIVVRGETGAEALDSFSAWVDDRPYVYVGTDKTAGVRNRFDVAHELGHLLLHRNVPPATASRAAEHALIEKQAHRFAGAFLLPQRGLGSLYAPTLNAFRYLKQHWHVSISAILHRCTDLGLVDSEQSKRLWVMMARRGWRREEPLDDVIPVEEPRLLRTAFELLVQRQPNLRSSFGTQIGLSDSDVEELGSLPAGFLSDDPPPVELVDFKRSPRRKTEPHEPRDNVVTLIQPAVGESSD